MIDEKKIKEAADEYCAHLFSETIPRPRRQSWGGDTTIFKAGINWLKENLWHDGEEVPKEKDKNVLMYFETYSVDEMELDSKGYYELCKTGKDGFNENTWRIFCDAVGWCSNWLYIEDLM